MTTPPATSSVRSTPHQSCFHDFARGVTLFLSLVLLYTGFAKLTDPAGFARILQSQGLISTTAPFLAWAVPIAELAAATFALYALATALPSLRAAAWSQTLLFAVFAAYCTLLWSDPPGTPVPCGCGFSRSLVADWSGPALRAGVLTALAAFAALLLHTRASRPL